MFQPKETYKLFGNFCCTSASVAVALPTLLTTTAAAWLAKSQAV